MHAETPAQVLSFWMDDVGKDKWFSGGDALDDAIRDRFAATWEAAAAGQLEHWRRDGPGALAYVLVTDQFSRNMFRGDPRSFATDAQALRAAKGAIARGADRAMTDPMRHFLLLPFMHSEIASEQARGVRLLLTRMSEPPASVLLHARAHRTVIRRYGRFPHRNADLGRQSTAAEQRYLEEGGYGAVVRSLEGTT